MPVVYVTTDLIGLIMIGISLFMLGGCAGVYWFIKVGYKYAYKK